MHMLLDVILIEIVFQNKEREILRKNELTSHIKMAD
jgi:hypothetical protein